jgi:hypothetical protein
LTKDTIRRITALGQINSATNYLEIGIADGSNFNGVQIPRKTGVDIDLTRFQPGEDTFQGSARLYEESSDNFFRTSAEGIYDIIFLDGLHTAEQTFRDFLSSLDFASPSTIWLIDDVLPNSALSSVPDLHKWHKIRRLLNSDEGQWHGDVFRCMLLMRATFSTFSFATITDQGNPQSLVWRGKNPAPCINLSLEEIARFTYFDLIENLSLLNPVSEDSALNIVRDSL